MELRNVLKFNIIASLIINFRMFSFRDALRLPVIVFGSLKIGKLSGRIILTCPIRRGLIRIGQNAEMNCSTTNSSYLSIEGEWYIDGQVVLGCDVALIIKNTAKFYMGDGSCLRNRTKSIITRDVRFGRYVRLSHDSSMMTSNFHYMVDVNTGMVGRMDKEIMIGDYCWISNNCTIMPGTVIPPYTIVASHSMVNKDFSHLEKYSVIGGMPARFLKSGVARVFNTDAERVIQQYFDTHPDADEYNASDLDIYYS